MASHFFFGNQQEKFSVPLILFVLKYHIYLQNVSLCIYDGVQCLTWKKYDSRYNLISMKHINEKNSNLILFLSSSSSGIADVKTWFSYDSLKYVEWLNITINWHTNQIFGQKNSFQLYIQGFLI